MSTCIYVGQTTAGKRTILALVSDCMGVKWQDIGLTQVSQTRVSMSQHRCNMIKEL
jgi:hypothetical protein